jgi:hypothetical protein
MRFLILAAVILTVNSKAAPLPAAFIKALHQAETGGRYGDIKGDFVNGVPRSRGPFQISRAYWHDSGVRLPYSKAADYSASVAVVNAYLNRYAPRAVQLGDYETLARVHNGGPDGLRNRRTISYWLRIKAALK